MLHLDRTNLDTLRVAVAAHIGAAEVLPNGLMRCPNCGGTDFGPTMSLADLAVYEDGYLPGAPLLAGVCLDCHHITEPTAFNINF